MPLLKSGQAGLHRNSVSKNQGWSRCLLNNVILWVHQKQATQWLILALYQSNKDFRWFLCVQASSTWFLGHGLYWLETQARLDGQCFKHVHSCQTFFFWYLVLGMNSRFWDLPVPSISQTELSSQPLACKISVHKTMALTKCCLPPYLKRKGTPASLTLLLPWLTKWKGDLWVLTVFQAHADMFEVPNKSGGACQLHAASPLNCK